MSRIGRTISLSIKENKWVEVFYSSSNQKQSRFWISINDIDFDKKIIMCNEYNTYKNDNVLENVYIYYENITNAEIIDNTYYEVKDSLKEKLEANFRDTFFEYGSFKGDVLEYYRECNHLDNDPYQKESFLVPGLDKDYLLKNKIIKLNIEQITYILSKIREYKYNQDYINDNFVISALSIDIDAKKYIICYYKLNFNPLNKTLSADKELSFNETFKCENSRFTLAKYADGDIEKFIFNLKNNFDEYVDILKTDVTFPEQINTRPELLILERKFTCNLTETFEYIDSCHFKKSLSNPLKAFFGIETFKDAIKTENNRISIFDNINIDQLLAIDSGLNMPVSYVQGPPGTGKTQTIFNLLLSCFLDSKKVLVCSTNNKPVDALINKLTFKIDDKIIPFPCLRLGNYEEIRKSLKQLKYFFEIAKHNYVSKDFKSYEEKLNCYSSELNNFIDEYKQRKQIASYLNELNLFMTNSHLDIFYKITKKINIKKSELEKKLNQTKCLNDCDLASVLKNLKNDKDFYPYLLNCSLIKLSKLNNKDFDGLRFICDSDSDKSIKVFNDWIKEDINLKMLTDVFPIIFSTNISCEKLGSCNFQFDLCVMDESGQCNIASSLLPISRAQRLMLVGDIQQLQPVIVMDDCANEVLKKKYQISSEFDYKNNSIMKLMENNDKVSNYILLKNHYRCGKKIIDFSNKLYYKNELDLSNIKDQGNLELVDVKNLNNCSRNSSYEEANVIVNYVKKNNLKNTTVVTPFVNQETLINKMLKDSSIAEVKCGTIHSLQGDEKDTIILSSSISPKTSKATYDWLKNNSELINVAVTRAKHNLIVVADYEVLKKLSNENDEYRKLIEYTKNNGNYNLVSGDPIKIQIGYSNNSENEEEFYKTMYQFCSMHKKLKVRRNVLYSNLFSDDQELSKLPYEADEVIYEHHFLRYKPIIIFEIDGGEHHIDSDQTNNDTIKNDVAYKYGIQVIHIDNSFVKSYEYLKELILKLFPEI